MEKVDYASLASQAVAITSSEPNLIANLANVSAILNMGLSDINWVGFYLLDGSSQQLVLGPFQGNPACVRIDIGKGVCGTAFATESVQRVADVHQFAGHIACDAASQSEIVLPFYVDDQLIGVLDIDSPLLNRFSEHDERGLTEFVEAVGESLSTKL